MSRRYLVPALVGLVAVSAAVAPAQARHKKPITKTYTATAQVPDPSPFASGTGICRNQIPQSMHVQTFAAPEAGTFEVSVTPSAGDWALSVRNDKDQTLGDSDQGTGEPLDKVEKVKLKLKKATKLKIVACNFAGGPTSTVKYTFTYL